MVSARRSPPMCSPCSTTVWPTSRRATRSSAILVAPLAWPTCPPDRKRRPSSRPRSAPGSASSSRSSEARHREAPTRASIGGVTSSLTGRLLVAAPGVLEDANFRRTVVLLLEHGDQGALGVVLNRASDTPVLDPFPGWDDVATAPTVLFVGGPVSQQMIIALAKPHPGADPEGWHQVLPGDLGRLG